MNKDLGIISYADTTDVQSASVEQLRNGSLLLKCTFGEGSCAQGCQLTIALSLKEGVTVSYNVSVLRKNYSSLEVEKQHHSQVEGGVLQSVLARDIECNGSIGGIALPGMVKRPSVPTRE